MKLTHVEVLPAPPEKVYQALLDPRVLRDCVEGCQGLEAVEPGIYDVHFRSGSGRLEIRDENPPSGLTLVLEGKRLGASIRSTARVRLHRKGEGTELVADGEAKLGGLAALLPSSRVREAAREHLSGFFEKLAAKVR